MESQVSTSRVRSRPTIARRPRKPGAPHTSATCASVRSTRGTSSQPSTSDRRQRRAACPEARKPPIHGPAQDRIRTLDFGGTAHAARPGTPAQRNVHRLSGVLAKVSIEPLEYATRAHEILEDAARDLLSGTDVPWSGEGVLATNAGLASHRRGDRDAAPAAEGPREHNPDRQDRTRCPALGDGLACRRPWRAPAEQRAAHPGNRPSCSTAGSAGRSRRCPRCPERSRPNSRLRFPRSQSARCGSTP